MTTRLGLSLLTALAAAAFASCGSRPEEPAYDVAPVLANREEITRAMRSVGAGMDARVVLLVRVDERGYVREVRVDQSSGNDELDSAAMWIGEQMRFEPARYQGNAVAALVRVPVTFDLVSRVSYPPRLRNPDEIVNRMVNEYGDLRGRGRIRANVGPEGWIRQTRDEDGTSDEAISAMRRLVDDVTFWPGYRGDQRIASWVTLVFEFAGPESRVFIESSGD